VVAIPATAKRDFGDNINPEAGFGAKRPAGRPAGYGGQAGGRVNQPAEQVGGL